MTSKSDRPLCHLPFGDHAHEADLSHAAAAAQALPFMGPGLVGRAGLSMCAHRMEFVCEQSPQPPNAALLSRSESVLAGRCVSCGAERSERRAEKAKKLLLQRAARRQPRRGSNVHVCVVCSEWPFVSIHIKKHEF